jgi:hypothetical protein
VFDDDRLPRFRGNRFSIEVDSSDPWWEKIFKKLAPDGILRKRADANWRDLPSVDVKIEIEGITRTLTCRVPRIDSMEYRAGVSTATFHFVDEDAI